jgi:hypothetical protein
LLKQRNGNDCARHIQFFGRDARPEASSTNLQLGALRMTNTKPRAAYFLLFAIQMAGALFVVGRELPDFRQLLLNPGFQLPYMRTDDFVTSAAVVAMQVAYWYRIQRVPIPYQRSKLILSHLLLFLGRLSFVFGGSVFAVVFFRHLPELDRSTDALLLVKRGLFLLGALFALFCFTLELERLGHSLEDSQ